MIKYLDITKVAKLSSILDVLQVIDFVEKHFQCEDQWRQRDDVMIKITDWSDNSFNYIKLFFPYISEECFFDKSFIDD